MVNDETLDLIKSFEGCKLTAYKDAAGVPTIGYGHIKGVSLGTTITQAQADQFLREDLHTHEQDVDDFLAGQRLTLTENERGALVSFTFNLGAGNLRKLFRDGLPAVPERMLLFNKARVNGVLKPLKGLTRRRMAEQALYLKADTFTAGEPANTAGAVVSLPTDMPGDVKVSAVASDPQNLTSQDVQGIVTGHADSAKSIITRACLKVASLITVIWSAGIHGKILLIVVGVIVLLAIIYELNKFWPKFKPWAVGLLKGLGK